MTPLVIPLEIHTENPANGGRTPNSRLAAIFKRRTYEKIRDQSFQIMSGRIRDFLPKVKWPVSVTIVRLSAGKMDDDGIAAATKGIRDSVAQCLGVDDGDTSKVRFSYAGRKVPQGTYGVEVRIESMRVACICEHTLMVHDNLGCTVDECQCLASRPS